MDFKSIFAVARQENQSCFPQLSWNERLIGFGICFVIGYAIQLFSFMAFLSLLVGDPTKFAITYSLGNMLTWAATGFLIGFRKQLSNMVDKQRRVTSLIFVSSLFLTLFSALVLKSRILVFLFLLIQIPAYIWYVATYIPFARNCLKSCLGGCLKLFKK